MNKFSAGLAGVLMSALASGAMAGHGGNSNNHPGPGNHPGPDNHFNQGSDNNHPGHGPFDGPWGNDDKPTSSVPEPEPFALILAGIAGVALVRRLQK